jgi:hypothetical protein
MKVVKHKAAHTMPNCEMCERDQVLKESPEKETTIVVSRLPVDMPSSIRGTGSLLHVVLEASTTDCGRMFSRLLYTISE